MCCTYVPAVIWCDRHVHSIASLDVSTARSVITSDRLIDELYAVCCTNLLVTKIFSVEKGEKWERSWRSKITQTRYILMRKLERRDKISRESGEIIWRWEEKNNFRQKNKLDAYDFSENWINSDRGHWAACSSCRVVSSVPAQCLPNHK